jgi:hypothetical protein
LIVQMKTDVLLVGACSLLLTQMRYEHRNRFGEHNAGRRARAAGPVCVAL